MSGRKVKTIRRVMKKNSNKIKLDFLNSICYEPFKVRFKLAVKILFKRKPKDKK